MSLFLGWIVFLAAVVLIGIIAFALIQWARTSEELAWAEAAFDDCDEKRVAAVRELQKLREARPDKARMVDYLDAVPVRRAGVLAAIREMQRVVAIGSERSAEDLARDAIAIDVDGAVNFLALVPAVIRAVDQAIADLELERAAQAAIAGEPLDTRHIGEGGAIREIPIRTLGDVAAEARSTSFGGLSSEGNEFAGRKAAEAGQRTVFDDDLVEARYSRPDAADLPRPDLPEGAPIDAPAGTKLTFKIDGVQPTEAVHEANGSWTLRRRNPANPAKPFRSMLEERNLTDQDMIDRGFDLDAILASIAEMPKDQPIRIDMEPFPFERWRDRDTRLSDLPDRSERPTIRDPKPGRS